jgi:Flp pilus assembly protein TadG
MFWSSSTAVDSTTVARWASSAGSTAPIPAPRCESTSLRSEKGQAAVEFALVVPVICLLVLALIDFGKALNYWLDTSHLANEGARMAAVLGNSAEPGGNWKQWIQQQAETTELRNGTGSVTSPAQVCVSFPNGAPKIGDPVRVTVSAPYKWIPFVGGATINLRAEATMRLERMPTYAAGCYP